MWYWKKTNSNYIRVSDENGWNRASFVRKNANSPWEKNLVTGIVPFTTESPEFLAIVPVKKVKGEVKGRESLNKLFSIKVENSLYEKLRAMSNDEIRQGLRKIVESEISTLD